MHIGRNLRSTLGAIMALLWVAPLPGLAQNQPSARVNASPLPRGELSPFEVFLDRHPFIEARLRENPGLLNDPAFRRNHPMIAEFLDQHPGIRAELAARPRWFIHRELVRQSAAPVTAAQVADFDRLLDQHPGLERQLALHPQLLRNQEFLSHHPELHEFLRRHPGIDRPAESRPGRLMPSERRNGNAGRLPGEP